MTREIDIDDLQIGANAEAFFFARGADITAEESSELSDVFVRAEYSSYFDLYRANINMDGGVLEFIAAGPTDWNAVSLAMTDLPESSSLFQDYENYVQELADRDYAERKAEYQHDSIRDR